MSRQLAWDPDARRNLDNETFYLRERPRQRLEALVREAGQSLRGIRFGPWRPLQGLSGPHHDLPGVHGQDAARQIGQPPG